jgi:tetratricopeptide (TPR) repeat protein
MLLLVLTLALSVQADADTLYALGNRLYAEGDFRGAAAAYGGAAETGWTSPDLELALGAAYFEAGETGRAVLHFERARRLAPRDPDIQHNLRLARERANAESSRLAPADTAARWLSSTVGAGVLVALLFVCYLAALGLVGYRLWRGSPMPWLRRTLLVLVPLGLFVTVAAVGAARYDAQPRAVIVADAADVFADPSATSAATATVAEGSVLTVLDTRGRWHAVRLPDGGRGWVAAAALEEV